MVSHTEKANGQEDCAQLSAGYQQREADTDRLSLHSKDTK